MEQWYFRGRKGVGDKYKRYCHQYNQRGFCVDVKALFTLKKLVFNKVGYCGADKKYGYIEPIRIYAEDACIGVVEYGYQNKAKT